MPIKAIL